jgi:hypothetical protein
MQNEGQPMKLVADHVRELAVIIIVSGCMTRDKCKNMPDRFFARFDRNFFIRSTASELLPGVIEELPPCFILLFLRFVNVSIMNFVLELFFLQYQRLSLNRSKKGFLPQYLIFVSNFTLNKLNDILERRRVILS